MSIHRSLATAGKLKRHRNVLTRSERLDILKKDERWKEGMSIFGLPKVRSILARAKKKEKEATADAAAPAAGAAAAGAAPAKDAKAAPAKDAKAAAPKKDEKKK
jgi:small basic protein (TIGR04137 family)